MTTTGEWVSRSNSPETTVRDVRPWLIGVCVSSTGYKEGDFFRKGMSNVSTVKLGDDRLRFETTLQHDSMKMVRVSFDSVRFAGGGAVRAARYLVCH